MITATTARHRMDSQPFWVEARMWCLLHGMPWAQLGGSRRCGALYLRHLRRNTLSDDERDAFRAVERVFDHAKAIRPDDLSPFLSQPLRNYTTALFVHAEGGRDALARIAAADTLPDDITARVASAQQQILAHLSTHDGDPMSEEWNAWSRSPACWEQLTV